MSKLEHLSISITPADPGYRLVSLLVAKTQKLAQEQKIHSLQEACEMMGITQSHFTLYRNGGADISHISKDKIDSFAKFLGLPSISIRFLADQIGVEDFYRDNDTPKFKKEIKSAIDVIANDDTWGPLLPSDIYKAGKSLQLYTIRLYEEATEQKLLHEGADLGKLIRKSSDIGKSA